MWGGVASVSEGLSRARALQLSFSGGAGAGDRKPWLSPSKLAMCWQLGLLVAGAEKGESCRIRSF